MKTFSLSNRLAVLLFAGSLAASASFAQGVFEGSGEVSDPNCVGDGCGFVSAEQSSEQSGYEYSAPTDSNEAAIAQDSATVDSLQAPDTTEVAPANIDEEDDDRPHYINESAAEYRARKEGFSKGVQFGVRVAGGASKSFGNKADDWNLGFEGGAGLMARLPLGNTLGVAAELNFSYRHYSYEGKTDYSNNKATIDEMLFEIPVMAQYVFDEDGLFMGIGLNLGLKMSGDSEFKQNTTINGKQVKSTNSNTIPTEGVEIGGLFDIGFVVNRWMVLDLRVIQNFTNTLDQDLIAESTLMHSKLYTMHTTLGVTFLL